MPNKLTAEEVRESVKDTVKGIIDDFGSEPDTDRETLIERMDEECDSMFGNLVQHGRVSDYDVQDLVRTAQPCAILIEVAEEDAWVEDDAGLWEGSTFGVAACIAFYSLRNLLYQAMADAGHDSNDDYPFAVEEESEATA